MEIDIPLKIYAKLKLMEFPASVDEKLIIKLLKENKLDELAKYSTRIQECDAKA